MIALYIDHTLDADAWSVELFMYVEWNTMISIMPNRIA